MPTTTDRLNRAADLQSRNRPPVIGGERPAYITPSRPSSLLPHLSDADYALLIDQLLEDWDCPTLSELGLCRAHRLTLEELDQITDDPAFDRALARIRSIREKRRPEREAAARAQVFDRLRGLLAQPQDTAARAREVRLAAKQLLALLTPPSNPGAEGCQPSDRPFLPPASGGGAGADEGGAGGSKHQADRPSPNRSFGLRPNGGQVAPRSREKREAGWKPAPPGECKPQRNFGLAPERGAGTPRSGKKK